MRTDRWARVKELFGGALDVEPGARDAWVGERCGSDPELAEEVRALLRHAATTRGASRLDLLAEIARDGDAPDRAAGPEGSPDGAVRVSPDVLAAARGLSAGSELAGRYSLQRRLAVGAFGSVYAATDRLTGDTVAVKALFPDDTTTLDALRREVATLRRARLPGVVKLLDDWSEDGAAFIVMELVAGSPFPGCPEPASWAGIARPTVALLEAVDRLHWLGILHRDLKPANVIVDEHGCPTVVDLGIAVETAARAPGGQFAYVVGTPGYLAPERLRGDPATKATDIYALGVMLWESLAGRALQPARTIAELVHLRCRERPPSLLTVAPDVPPRVAAIVDAMLDLDPARRPLSAGIAARALLGECDLGDAAHAPLPRLGGTATVDRVVAGLLEGRSMDVVGVRGSGRSRLATDVTARLAAADRQVFVVAPASGPLRALRPAIGSPPRDSSSEEAVEWASARLIDALRSGAIVVVDDADGLDPLSSSAVGAARQHGPVLRTLLSPAAASIALTPLDETDLLDLFPPSSRFSHVREDAARTLYRATSGLPGRVASELERWVGDGLARRERDHFAISRPALDRLEHDIHSAAPPPLRPVDGLGDDARELAGMLEVAAVALPEASLPSLIGGSRWEAESALAELVAASCVALEGVAPDRVARLISAPGVSTSWDSARRRRAHLAVAEVLPTDSEERLFHLVAGDAVAATTREAAVLVDRLLAEGQVGRARTLAVETLSALRRDGAGEDGPRRAERVARVLRALLRCALASASPSELETVLYHVASTRSREPAIVEIERVARGALSAVRGDAVRALADTSSPARDDEVERARQAVRAFAAQARPTAEHRAVLVESSRWARRSCDSEDRARFAEWLGWLRYREQRFREALCLQRRAARRWQSPRAALRAALNAATAAVEAGRHDEAVELAAMAASRSAELRDTYGEVWAAWLTRTASYRRGGLHTPDRDLADAALAIPNSRHTALLVLNEAAVAWRTGDLEIGGALATRAAAYSLSVGDDVAELLCSCLAEACGVHADESARAELERRVQSCELPRVALQCAALLAPTTRAGGVALRAVGEASFESVPPESGDVIAEVLSADEAMETLAAASRSGVRCATGQRESDTAAAAAQGECDE